MYGLFGTDGVRGPVPDFLDSSLAKSLAEAAVDVVCTRNDSPSVLILRDTRESGPALEQAVVEGVVCRGGVAIRAGVLPTPAASLLLKRYNYDLAVVISASHNPYRDNGIKFFASSGLKLSEQQESEIEGRFGDSPPADRPSGSARDLLAAESDYLRELRDRFELDLSGWRIVLDCANGATYKVAPHIFKELGAEVELLAVEPDGRNINDGVGSTEIGLLRDTVVSGRFDIGFAFDGDGDRVIAVASNGRVLDGDDLLAVIAKHLKDRDQLAGGGVALTVMSNFGLQRVLEGQGIEVATTDVGDKYVSAELEQRGWVLGGEPSGHIINSNFNSTGDGIAAAMFTLEAAQAAKLDLAAEPIFERLPQCLINVSVNDKSALATADRIWQEFDRRSAELGDSGRIVVRPSGTEQVVRVMVEAIDESEGKSICERLSKLVGEELNSG